MAVRSGSPRSCHGTRDDPRIAVVELQNEISPQNREAVAWVTTIFLTGFHRHARNVADGVYPKCAS